MLDIQGSSISVIFSLILTCFISKTMFFGLGNPFPNLFLQYFYIFSCKGPQEGFVALERRFIPSILYLRHFFTILIIFVCEIMYLGMVNPFLNISQQYFPNSFTQRPPWRDFRHPKRLSISQFHNLGQYFTHCTHLICKLCCWALRNRF